jgi:hypothetical protein
MTVYAGPHARASASDQSADGAEKSRRVRLGQIMKYAREVSQVPLPQEPRSVGVVRAVLATGMPAGEAHKLAPWITTDGLAALIREVDMMFPNEINGAWLGNQIELTSGDRERLKLWKIWPAGWQLEQIEERSRQRDVEKRRLKRAEQENRPMDDQIADYKARVRARAGALLKLIPLDRPISVAELTTRTARRREFSDANGKPLSAPTRHRILHPILDQLCQDGLIKDQPEFLPNGGPVRCVARIRV